MPLDGYSLDQCLRKEKYASYGAAADAAKGMLLKKGGIVIQPYRCHFRGDHWHIGRPAAAKRREAE